MFDQLGLQRLLDHRSRLINRDVLPNTDDLPSVGRQRGVGHAVSFDVSLKLRRPVPLVVRRLAPVKGTRMPKAAVDEHGHAAASEYEVGPDPAVWKVEAVVLAEPSASPVQQRPQGDLRLRVAATDGCQVPRSPWALGGRAGRLRCGARVSRGHSRNVGRRWWGRPRSWGKMGTMACALPVRARIDEGEQR